jgi:hypothetical protein
MRSSCGTNFAMLVDERSFVSMPRTMSSAASASPAQTRHSAIHASTVGTS